MTARVADPVRIGDCIHRALVETLHIPHGDRFQLITRHDDREIIYDRSFPDVDRSDSFILIQITLAAGRDREQKKELYAGIAALLSSECDVRPADIFITLTEVPPENFSFGNGQAQFADRLPPHLASGQRT
jgi:4-oxalocrotonate tautomerase